MSERYPKIRIHARNGAVLLREGVNIRFYMRHSHRDLVHGVMRSLESCLRAVGSTALGWYDDGEGTWRKLDAVGWEHIRLELLEKRWPQVALRDALDGDLRYGFDYRGKALDEPPAADEPGAVSAVSFWLPTEFLEAHGPKHVRELALELAAPLPFCSGHAGVLPSSVNSICQAFSAKSASDASATRAWTSRTWGNTPGRSVRGYGYHIG
ncbi:type VI immunity family protein [Melittangium boletus]|uniref:type VI immunity family protein n=1 Tax=Melittangium boletus TaxID=83453 RepID=UPI003DA41768